MECTAINCYGRWGVIFLVQQEFVTILVRTVILECTTFNSDCTSRHISCRTGIDTVASVTFSIIIGRECTVFYSHLTTMMSPDCTTICTFFNLNNTITSNSQFRIVWHNDCITVCCRDSLTIQIQGCITLCDFNRRIEVQVFCKNNSSTHFNSLTQIPLCSRNKHYTFTNCYIRSSYAFIDNINSFSITCRTINGSNLTAIFYSYIPLHYCQCTNFNTCTNNSSVFCRSNHKRCNITLLDIHFTIRNLCFHFRNCCSYWNFNNNLSVISTTVFILNGNFCTFGNWSKRECGCISVQSSWNVYGIVSSCNFRSYVYYQIFRFRRQNFLIYFTHRRHSLIRAIATIQCAFTVFCPYNIANSNIYASIGFIEIGYFINCNCNFYIIIAHRNRNIEYDRSRSSIWRASIINYHYIFFCSCCFKLRTWRQISWKLSCYFLGSLKCKHMIACKFPIIKLYCNDSTHVVKMCTSIFNLCIHRNSLCRFKEVIVNTCIIICVRKIPSQRSTIYLI